MNKLSGNDLLEFWAIHGNVPKYTACAHERQYLDGRAKLMIEFVKMWSQMLMMPLHEAMQEVHGQPVESRPPELDALVMRAALVVDTIWDEAKRRGWVIQVPPFDEISAER